MGLVHPGFTLTLPSATVAGEATSSSISIDTIPNFSLGIGQTQDMSQYINDAGGNRTGTSMLTVTEGLLPGGRVSYSATTEELTGAATGVETNATLEVTGPTGTVTSNTFDVTVSGSDTPDYPDPLIGVTLLGGRTTVPATPGNLQAKLNAAVGGETIELAAGNYTAAYTINRTAPANNPIIIKGADNFTSVCSNRWTMGAAAGNLAENVIVTGILFSGALVNVAFYGVNNRLIGNKFTGWGDATIGGRFAITAHLSQFNEIAYNEFYEHGPWRDPAFTNQSRIAIRTSEGATGAAMPTDSWVHHNLFRDFPDKPVPTNYSSGQNDALEWGQTGGRGFVPTFSARLYFESNMILRCISGQGGPKVGFVDFKVAGDCVARYNTFKDSPVRMDRRGPSALPCTFESNYFDNESYGMDLHGCGSVVVGNVLDPGSFHARARNSGVAGNNGPLRVGRQYAAGFPVDNTLIEEHTGNISLQTETNTTNNGGQTTDINYTVATALTEAEVGPAGLDLASATYKAARGL
jgi:hypothetical protein